MKGYAPEEIIGRHFSVFYTPEARERGRPGHVLHTAANEGKFTEEGWRVRKDGTRFWASVVLTSLKTKDGQLRGFLKITRDLTDRHKLELADQQKNEFLATLSHEFRTHLNAILGWVALMGESQNDRALISEGLQVLQRNGETLAALVSGILEISRIITGALSLEFEEIDLKNFVEENVKTLQSEAQQKGLALDCFLEIPKQIGCRVWADKLSLQRILANIVSNSLKFTPEGGTVAVRLRKSQARAILTVKDTGIGMSPDFTSHAFERFAQAKRSNAGPHGLGLGLAICKHLVELHKGSISAESEGPGRGTTIKVELPLLASESPSSFEPSSQRDVLTKEAAMPDTRLKDIKVVAVDDDADTRSLLQAVLERSGAEATIVSSGQEALEEVRKTWPNVLICDLAMSPMDGYELLENVRGLRPSRGQLPAIAYTASARDEDRTRSRRVGFQAHLVKPVMANDLVTTIVGLVKPSS